MNIGITYDLREDYLTEGYSPEETAEFDKIETIDAIENSLKKMGHQTHKIGNIKMLQKALVAGHRWDLVFNIAEGMHGLAREAQIPALLDAYQIPYTFSDPVVLGLTLHKGLTKHVIHDCNIPTAEFLIVNEMHDLEKFKLDFPVFAKPVGEGTGKGINRNSKIFNQEDLAKVTGTLLETFKQPVLIESFLPGREFTVGITGSGKKAKSVGVMEIILNQKAEQDIYSYNNKQNYLELVEYKIPESEITKICEEVALASWIALGCRDGGRIDLRCDANGVPNFIEVNPLAGLNPVDSDLPIICRLKGISYNDLIKQIIDSALLRL